MEGACDCIYNPLMGPAYPSFIMIGPYVLVPYQYIGWNDVPQGETYIAYEVFEHLSWVHHEVGGGLQIVQSICKPLVSLVSPSHSPAMFTLQLHTKQQISGTLLVCQMSFYTVVRDIHCL